MEIRVLGPLEVLVHGLAIALGRRRERGLLGVLALHAGALVTFDRLYDLLWDGDPPESAVIQLRANASRIRATIGAAGYPDADGLIVAQGRGFRLHLDPSQVDAHRFRLLVEAADEHPPADRARLLGDALALWRGPILADAVSDQPRDRLARELDELRCLAIETKAQAELAIGRPQRALTTARTLSELHPHRESLVRLQMQGLVQAGRRAEAIDEYQRLKLRLAEDLGVDPEFGESSLAVAEELARQALAVARQAGLRKHTADALTILGHAADGAPAWREARALYEQLHSPRAAEVSALLAELGNEVATDRS